MSNKVKGGGKVPKLRFPEFRDEPGWAENTLGGIVSFHKGKGISKADVEQNGNTPCIRYGELYTKYTEVISVVESRTNRPIDELFLSRKNDVLIPSSGETKLDIATASCVELDDIALGGDINVLRSDQNGIFLSYYLNATKKYQIAKIAQGDTVVHLYSSQLKGLEVETPKPKEQQKIADCLSSIDEVIGAQAQKLDALKVHRNGLMQQLFPAESETVPKLRFPDFRDAGKWKQQKVSRLIKKVSNPVSVDLDERYRQIGIRSHGKGIFHKELVTGKVLGSKRVFWVVEDALVVNIVFAWEQAVAKTSSAERGMIASHRFPMYKAIPNRSDVHYVLYFFLTKAGKDLLWLASPGGAGRNKTLGHKEFENLAFFVPERVEEQTKIASCLSSIDDLITAQTQKIEALKAHKKGLMQQLFPAAGEAQG
jgi:type I restriction enzyme S subunit